MRFRSFTTALLTAALLGTGLFAAADPPVPLPLDTTFGSGGVVTNPGAGTVADAALGIFDDGSFVLTGVATNNHAADFGLVKRLSSGALDPSFGSGGIAVVDGGFVNLDTGDAPSAVQPDGRIVVATATTWQTGPQYWVVARVLPDGSPDPSFSGDGRLTVSFDVPHFYLPLQTVLVRPDGRIVIVGMTGHHTVAAQFFADGSVDRGFGTDGKLIDALPGGESNIQDAVLDSAGNLVVGGYAGVPDTGGDFLVARYLPDGTRDNSFGHQGTAVIDSGLGYDVGYAIDIDGDGRIVVVGAGPGYESGHHRPLLVRLLPTGQPDAAFGVNGRVILRVGGEQGDGVAYDVRALPDGRIAYAGYYTPDEYAHFYQYAAVVRPDGSLDPGFDGDNGVAELPFAAFAGGSIDLLPGGDSLLVYNRAGLSSMHTSTATADLTVTLSSAQGGQVGPGPLEMTATVFNNGPADATVTLGLKSTLVVAVQSSSGPTCFVDKSRMKVACKPISVPVGGSISVTVRATVTGYEGTVFLEGSLSSTTPDPHADDNTALLEVLTSTETTS